MRADLLGPRAMTIDVFATGLGRPLDVVVGPDGAPWVADFSNACFSGGSASAWRFAAIDSGADGTPDRCER